MRQIQTFQFHAGIKALLESTGRTLFTCSNRDRTGCSPQTHIVLLILDGPFEEALTALTRKNAVMEAGNFVAANGTRAVDQLLARNAGLRRQRRRVLG